MLYPAELLARIHAIVTENGLPVKKVAGIISGA